MSRNVPSWKKVIFLILLIFIFTLSCRPFPPNKTEEEIYVSATDSLIDGTPISLPTLNLTSTNEAKASEIDDGKEQSQKILKAIEDFYSDHKTYPTKLEDLIPDYLTEMPLTKTGQSFGYQLFERYEFILTFGLSSSKPGTFAYCAYLYSAKLWECGLEHLP